MLTNAEAHMEFYPHAPLTEDELAGPLDKDYADLDVSDLTIQGAVEAFLREMGV